MRFDDYLKQRGCAAIPVDQFDGFDVEVEGPHDWEAVEARPGLRVWVWRDDPYIQQFCANAVLTMHRIPARIDPQDSFSMLSDEQVQLAPGCHERHREAGPANDGIGIAGVLASQFDSEFGAIDSVSHSRIITTDEETLIAQLTLTALHDSPVDWAHVQLTVLPESQPRQQRGEG